MTKCDPAWGPLEAIKIQVGDMNEYLVFPWGIISTFDWMIMIVLRLLKLNCRTGIFSALESF